MHKKSFLRKKYLINELTYSMMNKKKPGNQNTANAGEYYMASILSAYGFVTTITLGRAESYDILAISPEGRNVKLQVKTLYGKGVQWPVGIKDGVDKKDNQLFYAFVRLNELKAHPDFWIVPSKVVSDYIPKNHRKWLNTPGKHGQKHHDTLRRSFRVKTDKYTPKDWTEKCEKEYYKKIELLMP
jgi:hypothetical protein